MTKLLYQTDSYLREFTAQVVEVRPEQRGIVLDQTAFYPGGGGQPHDLGEVVANGHRYALTKMERGYVHVLDSDELPAVGDQIEGTIDWERRYKLMRTHTAMHILCGVVWRDYGASVTGGNMEPLNGRMDFEFERMQGELVREIEAKINAEVEAAHDLRVRILPREEAFQIPDLIRTKINLLPEGITEVRTVEIVDLDLQADGGTHVANTREVGQLRIADYKSKGGINKRIYLELEP
ncbi:MAG: alanyl-tRNA editing protein [Anaerolineae bacterium]|nr:alanyl-tRNA editing protein [Anaerolineae bacterium]